MEIRKTSQSFCSTLASPLAAPLALLCGLLGGCPAEDYNIPHVVRSTLAEDAAYNCEVLALSSDWDCLPEERLIPLSCGWLHTDRSGQIIDEGSTGCVTMTCDLVLQWAELECIYSVEGEFILRDNPTAECCTADDCGVEFGCY